MKVVRSRAGVRGCLLGIFCVGVVAAITGFGFPAQSVASNQCTVNAAGDPGPAGQTATAPPGSSCCPDGSKPVGIVSFSKGGPPLGTRICKGDRPKCFRCDITLSDGTGTWAFWAGDSAAFDAHGNLYGVNGDFNGQFIPKGSKSSADVAASRAPTVTVTTTFGVVGAYVRHRLISFTLGAPKSRSEIFHVIDGEGFASQAGQPTLNVPAGYGAKLTQASVALTTKWPQKSLVPAGQRPPAISSLRFVARGSRVRLRLNRAAHLVVRVMRGKRVVRTRTAPGRKGVDTVALRTLRRGRYVLVVTAADKAGRTGLAQRSITAP